ncbi:MAG: 2-hydroxyglutaryl-CoA dehydratase [Syntrophomonadaceae bacterium]|nr:2-hydroxyglutaryl-CoA dehydratase [Syntrophomonadaceae bacterium]
MMLGIDLGSRHIKIVQMFNGKIGKSTIFDTIEFYRQHGMAGQKKLDIDFESLGFVPDQLTSTGYGKIAIAIEGAVQIPEIQAHAAGAAYQTGLKDFTLLDIGGQDTKIIMVRNGQVADFMTNDRCAASSGRYMENMASILGISLQELGLCSDEPVSLNSTCAIFGETEIISKIVEGYSTAQLAAGVNYTLYRRFAGQLKQLRSETLVLSGGGAFNTALMNIIAEQTGSQVLRADNYQFNGAIGCCVFEEFN